LWFQPTDVPLLSIVRTDHTEIEHVLRDLERRWVEAPGRYFLVCSRTAAASPLNVCAQTGCQQWPQ
jgi:hypothetical protein